MNIKGKEYNFGRCLRITFCSWNGNSYQPTSFIVEHAPELDRLKTIAMDVYVKDMPSASDKDQPGFMGNVTIYNPGAFLIKKISEGAVWLDQELGDEPENKKPEERATAVKNFFHKRLQVIIEAGYVQGRGDAKSANYNKIIKGFVQGSALYRKGTEWVLTFGIYDIDIDAFSSTIEDKYAEKTTEDYINEYSNNLFERTWYDTLIKYIKKYTEYRLPTEMMTASNTSKRIKTLGIPESQQPLARDADQLSVNQFPIRIVSEADREKSDWFEVFFVKSLDAYYQAKNSVGSNSLTVRGVYDTDLQEEVKATNMPEGGSVTGHNIAQMLNGLCAIGGNLHWVVDNEGVSKTRYIIWRGQPAKSFINGENAGIKIWNYQNLLESPAVAGNGMMTIKMIFNPKCKCLTTIALMLKNNIEVTDGTLVKASFQENLMESMTAQSSSLSTYGNIQVNGSNAVAALNKGVKDAQIRGNMFNKGFPIISVEHRLSTYGKDWTTIVKTSPSLSGFNLKK